MTTYPFAFAFFPLMNTSLARVLKAATWNILRWLGIASAPTNTATTSATATPAHAKAARDLETVHVPEFEPGPNLLVVGGACIDAIHSFGFGAKDLMGRKGKVEIDGATIGLGGSGATLTHALRALGINAGIAGAFAPEITCMLRRHLAGASFQHLRINESADVAFSTIWVSPENGDSTLLVQRAAQPIADLPLNEMIDKTAAVVIGPQPAANNWILLNKLRGLGPLQKVALLPGRAQLAILEQLLETRGISYLQLNHEEAMQATGAESPELAIAMLRSWSAKTATVVITAKDHALAWHGNRYYRVAAPGLNEGNVVDTTGAGDAFFGAAFASLLRGLSMNEALRNGHTNARSTILHTGAIAGHLGWERLRRESREAYAASTDAPDRVAKPTTNAAPAPVPAVAPSATETLPFPAFAHQRHRAAWATAAAAAVLIFLAVIAALSRQTEEPVRINETPSPGSVSGETAGTAYRAKPLENGGRQERR